MDSVYDLVNYLDTVIVMTMGFGIATAVLGVLAIVGTLFKAKRTGLYSIFIPGAIAGLFYVLYGCLGAVLGGNLRSVTFDSEFFSSLIGMSSASECFQGIAVPIISVNLFCIYKKVLPVSEKQGFKKIFDANLLYIHFAYLWAFIIVVSEAAAVGVSGKAQTDYINGNSSLYSIYQSLLDSGRAHQFACFGLWMFPVLAIIQGKMVYNVIRPIITSFGSYQFLLLFPIIGRTVYAAGASSDPKVHITFLFLLIDVLGIASIFMVIYYGSFWVAIVTAEETNVQNVHEIRDVTHSQQINETTSPTDEDTSKTEV
ncbi:hypothetical protein CLU79DRAFT_740088 [Phycomyces nitens]|nr:hypothetical protein CLU79DRAFT_740088 [Phycomyces nitens]